MQARNAAPVWSPRGLAFGEEQPCSANDGSHFSTKAWVFGGGLAEDVDPVMVAGDGTITVGTYPQIKEFNGGFTVLDVPSRDAACSRPRRSRPPAAVLKRSASSCPTRPWATDWAVGGRVFRNDP